MGSKKLIGYVFHNGLWYRQYKTFREVCSEKEIANGTPLPKGHGDLIDRDVAYDEFDKACFSYEGGSLNRIPAVIPADKE